MTSEPRFIPNTLAAKLCLKSKIILLHVFFTLHLSKPSPLPLSHLPAPFLCHHHFPLFSPVFFREFYVLPVFFCLPEKVRQSILCFSENNAGGCSVGILAKGKRHWNSKRQRQREIWGKILKRCMVLCVMFLAKPCWLMGRSFLTDFSHLIFCHFV